MAEGKKQLNLNNIPSELQYQIARDVGDVDYRSGDELNGNRSVQSLKATSRHFRDVAGVMEVSKIKEDISAIVSSARRLHDRVMENHRANERAGKASWEATLNKITPALHLQSDASKSQLEDEIMRLDENDLFAAAHSLIGHQDKLLPHGRKLVEAAYKRLTKDRDANEEQNLTEEDDIADYNASLLVGGGQSHLSKLQRDKITSLIDSGDPRVSNFNYYNDIDMTGPKNRSVEILKERLRGISPQKLSLGLENMAARQHEMKKDLFQSFGDVATEKIKALEQRGRLLAETQQARDEMARKDLAGAVRDRSGRGR